MRGNGREVVKCARQCHHSNTGSVKHNRTQGSSEAQSDLMEPRKRTVKGSGMESNGRSSYRPFPSCQALCAIRSDSFTQLYQHEAV